MILKITGVRDAGNLEKERIVMTASGPGDIGEFVLLQTGFREQSVTTGVFETFWFPDKPIAAGDFVVLYTKIGKQSDRPFKESTSHFFYWGLSGPIWQKPERAGVVMHAPDWQSFRAEQT